jgi:predicted acylesterase/phospholipase RssA/CRP-like cAMP-binding protein
MNLLTGIALFSGLSNAAKAELEYTSELRAYRKDEVVLRRGELGRFFFAITKGAVSVHPVSDQHDFSIILGPGEIFGEMALLSNSPVSATVIAERDSEIYAITNQTFDKLFANEPSFRDGIANLLAERLRRRTSAKERAPTCALIGMPVYSSSLANVLVRGVDYYARVIDVHGGLSPANRDVEAVGGDIESWRSSAREGEVCMAAVPTAWIGALRSHMRPGDALLLVDDGTSPFDLAGLNDWDFTNIATVKIGADARRSTRSDEMWPFRLDDAEIATAELAPEWNRTATPVLDSIVRWIARRAVGIALGAGAARGFAHIGVLGVLESAGVPIDCLSGSSIGGIIALVYAKTGSADGAFELSRTYLGSNQKIRDLCLFPRSSLFRGLKARRISERMAAGQHFADLTRPVFVVATDLLRGDRVVIDRGALATAALATSAIPGVFPPIETGSAWVVDGGIASRVPVDLLERRRCGLKIAVNVRSDPEAENDGSRRDLKRAMSMPFGLVRVIARSLDIVSLRHTATDVQGSDIVITPLTHSFPGTNFGAISSMVAVGKAEAERVLPGLLSAVDEVLRPRHR